MVANRSNWREKSREERTAERRAALIDAAIDIIGTEGAAALTTRAVARRTGLIERYLYESFSSRDELLQAAFDQVLAEQLDVLREAFESDPAAELVARLKSVASAILERFAEDPRIVRILLVEAKADAALAERTAMVVVALENLVVDFAGPLMTQSSPAEQRFLAKAMVGAAFAVFTAWNEGEVDLAQIDFVELSAWMASRFIG